MIRALLRLIGSRRPRPAVHVRAEEAVQDGLRALCTEALAQPQPPEPWLRAVRAACQSAVRS